MRIFYADEGPIDQLLQIAAAPVHDGNLIARSLRDRFVEAGWVARCHGWNIITLEGQRVIAALSLRRPSNTDAVSP